MANNQQSEFQRQQDLLRRQHAAAQLAAQTYAAMPEQLQAASQQSQRGMRSQAARALAGSISAGNIGGGAALAGAQDAAERVSSQMATEQMRATEAIQEAQANAATASIEALDREAELGSLDSIRKEAKEEYRVKLKDIEEEYLGGWNDDEEAMYDAMVDLAESEEDPEIKKWIMDYAEKAYNANTVYDAR